SFYFFIILQNTQKRLTFGKEGAVKQG
ncbi:MAG: hypothetical protein QG642_722, partial [Patescibacteria group bacterium]|nr:hypothetical protein [Patescibacteria group bacterium]